MAKPRGTPPIPSPDSFHSSPVFSRAYGSPGSPTRANPADNSGCGTDSSPLPMELRTLNIGAFFLCPIWGFAHGMPLLSIAALLPFPFGPIASVVALLKGNEWAWQRRKFASVEEFAAVQDAWLRAAWVALPFIVVLILAAAWFIRR